MLLPRKRGKALIEALNRGFAPGRAAHPTLAGRQGPGYSGPRPIGYCQVWARQGLLDASVCVPP